MGLLSVAPWMSCLLCFRISVALLPRDSMRESKTALVHRLRAMNDQMSVMDEMSRNIESEFHHSRKVSGT